MKDWIVPTLIDFFKMFILGAGMGGICYYIVLSVYEGHHLGANLVLIVFTIAGVIYGIQNARFTYKLYSSKKKK